MRRTPPQILLSGKSLCSNVLRKSRVLLDKFGERHPQAHADAAGLEGAAHPRVSTRFHDRFLCKNFPRFAAHRTNAYSVYALASRTYFYVKTSLVSGAPHESLFCIHARVLVRGMYKGSAVPSSPVQRTPSFEKRNVTESERKPCSVCDSDSQTRSHSRIGSRCPLHGGGVAGSSAWSHLFPNVCSHRF